MKAKTLLQILDDLRRYDSALWRRAMDAGIKHGPDAWVRYSPPFFGVAFAAGLPRQRRAVQKNLRLILGERSALREAADVARVFASYASCLTEAFIAGSDRGDAIRVTCADGAILAAHLAEGRGVILATAHAGGWQIAGPILQRVHAADVLVVMRRERDARAQAIQDEARARASRNDGTGGGLRIALLGDDPLDALPLLSHLKRGGVVAVQIDRLPRGMRGRKGELFGAPFEIPEGPLRLASMSGAPIVPVFTRRLGYMEYEVHVSPAIRLPRRPTADELDRAAAALLGAIEMFVRANPTQWFQFE